MRTAKRTGAGKWEAHQKQPCSGWTSKGFDGICMRQQETKNSTLSKQDDHLGTQLPGHVPLAFQFWNKNAFPLFPCTFP